MTDARATTPEPKKPRMRFGLFQLIFVMFLLGTAASFGGVALRSFRDRIGDRRTETCRRHLRDISLAMGQYADKLGAFPHLGLLGDLDHGGKTLPAGSDVSPRIVRALFFHAYLDDPEVAICPSSDDEPSHSWAAIKKDPRVFGWGGSVARNDPIASPATMDVDGDKLTDLSYGVTIHGWNANAMNRTALVADRARRGLAEVGAAQTIDGNHRYGWYVGHIDGNVTYVGTGTSRAKELAGTNAGDGFLSVWDDSNNGLTPFQ